VLVCDCIVSRSFLCCAVQAQDLVARAVKMALGQAKYTNGLVVDGLVNHYCDAKAALKLLLPALGLRPNVPEPDAATLLEQKKASKPLNSTS
jgi:hypothetical protein